MNTEPGRNAPCYCGSGKKYKRCHLPLDEAAHPAPAPGRFDNDEQSPDEPDEGAPGRRLEMGNFKNISDVFKLASSSGLMKRDPGLRKIFKENETLLTYLG